MKHSLTFLKSVDSKTEIKYRDVIFKTLDDKEFPTLPPAKRTY